MKYTYWAASMIIAGLVGLVFIVMFQSLTVNSETEYYVLKEAMEAAMLESVDIACYRDSNSEGCGEVLKISSQKFVENFTRRFAKNISGGDANSYRLSFYDIVESPPKATVVVDAITKEYSLMVVPGENDDGSFEIKTNLSGILEYDPLRVLPGSITITPDVNINDIKSNPLTINLNSNQKQPAPENGNQLGESEESKSSREDNESYDSHQTRDDMNNIGENDEIASSDDEEEIGDINYNQEDEIE